MSVIGDDTWSLNNACTSSEAETRADYCVSGVMFQDYRCRWGAMGTVGVGWLELAQLQQQQQQQGRERSPTLQMCLGSWGASIITRFPSHGPSHANKPPHRLDDLIENVYDTKVFERIQRWNALYRVNCTLPDPSVRACLLPCSACTSACAS